jgi:hypothetical protein
LVRVWRGYVLGLKVFLIGWWYWGGSAVTGIRVVEGVVVVLWGIDFFFFFFFVLSWLVED